MIHLGTRLFLIVTLIVVSVTLAYDSFLLQRERGTLIAQLEREVSLMSRALEGPLQVWVRTGRVQQFEALLRDIRLAVAATCAGVYDGAGRLVLASTTDPAEADDASDCPEALDTEGAIEATLSRWSPLGTFKILTPLARDTTEEAVTLKLVLPSTVITDPLRRQRSIIFMERGLVLAGIGAVLWLAISVSVSRPIRRLVHGVEEISRGKLDTQIVATSRTEIGALARAFNRMVQSLREAQDRSRAEEERRVAVERQLRHADKLAVIGKLASELAHEVGTPLNVISGRARMLRRDLSDGDPRTENLDIIRIQVDRISRVIRRFLEAGRAPRMHKKTADLAAIVREVATFVAPEVRRKGVHLALPVPSRLPAITADPDGLSQVILNLLMNALAAVPRGGRISVSLAQADAPAGDPLHDAAEPRPAAGVEICVSDNGHGIEPAIQGRIFDPFFSTKPEEGSGLGLSICRDICREHGGDIAVDSRPGNGTRVRVWLPVAPSEVSHEPTTRSHH
jgi:signal transduction histidine kinase